MKQAQQRLCRAALRMSNLGLARGWQTWREFSAHRKRALGVLRASARFFLGYAHGAQKPLQEKSENGRLAKIQIAKS